jgi:hypothetical protein
MIMHDSSGVAGNSLFSPLAETSAETPYATNPKLNVPGVIAPPASCAMARAMMSAPMRRRTEKASPGRVHYERNSFAAVVRLNVV